MENEKELEEKIKRLQGVNDDLLRKNYNQRKKLRVYNGFSKSIFFKLYLLFHKKWLRKK
jgi:hypothetical protein